MADLIRIRCMLVIALCSTVATVSSYKLTASSQVKSTYKGQSAKCNNFRKLSTCGETRFRTQISLADGIQDYGPQFASYLQNDVSFYTVAPIVAGSFFIFKFAVYWKMQFISAGIVSGIPAKSTVVEIDALDGKNIFYLPKGTDFTAVMSPGQMATETKDKIKEKARINEQLIIESVGKANRGGLEITGKVRTRTQDIPSKSVDCVLSVGALGRAGQSSAELVTEIYRMLRPGGLFVFVEADGAQTTINTISNIFPLTINGGLSAGAKAKEAKMKKEKKALGVVEKKLNSKKVRKTVKSGESVTQPSSGNVATFSLGDLEVVVEEGEKVGETEEEQEKEMTDTDDSSAPPPVSLKSASRPGITSERIQNLFDPYVTGIAVRP